MGGLGSVEVTHLQAMQHGKLLQRGRLVERRGRRGGRRAVQGRTLRAAAAGPAGPHGAVREVRLKIRRGRGDPPWGLGGWRGLLCWAAVRVRTGGGLSSFDTIANTTTCLLVTRKARDRPSDYLFNRLTKISSYTV